MVRKVSNSPGDIVAHREYKIKYMFRFILNIFTFMEKPPFFYGSNFSCDTVKYKYRIRRFLSEIFIDRSEQAKGNSF